MPTPNPPSPTKSATDEPLPPDHPAPKTPQSLYALPPSSTPTTRGAAVRHKQEGNPDRFDNYDRAEYDDYIREDLGRRVFVDFEVFLKRVLQVPEGWREEWGPAIKAVKADKEFNNWHEKYRSLCDKEGGHEVTFYEPLMHMVNSILDVVTSSSFGKIPSKKRQYYRVNNPFHLRGGVINKAGLSPDLVLLDYERAASSSKGPLHWANVLQVIEVKPHDNAICDGRNMPKLVVDGKRAGRCFRDEPRLTIGQELIHL